MKKVVFSLLAGLALVVSFVTADFSNQASVTDIVPKGSIVQTDSVTDIIPN